MHDALDTRNVITDALVFPSSYHSLIALLAVVYEAQMPDKLRANCLLACIDTVLL